MKKFYNLLIAAFVGILTLNAAETITLNGVVHTIDTTAVFPIGPGSKYIAMTMTRTDGKVLHVFQTIIDKSSKYIDCEVLMGRDSILWGEPVSSVAKRHSYEKHNIFAATNGDFYKTQGYVGLPTSLTISCNQLAHTPENHRKGVAFDENNVPYIGVVTFNGSVSHKDGNMAISHVNHVRDENELVLYNQLQGTNTRTNEYGTEVSVELCKGESWGMNKTIKLIATKKIAKAGSSIIEKGKAVLSGHGTAADYLNKFEVGDTITIELNTFVDDKKVAVANSTGAEPRSLMLKDGVVEQNDVWDQLHPRTGFGYSITKDSLISCVVDGRGKSIGCTTKVLAEIMKSAGAYTAVNLDGGGSSTMYIQPYGPMNTTSDGNERAVCNGIHYINNAPTDNVVSKISANINHIVLPPYGTYKPHVLGYNQYGMLINTNLEDFTLECDKSLGYIKDGQLVASGDEDGYLTIKHKDASCKVHIIKNNNAEINFRLDSVVIDNFREYPIEVEAIIDRTHENILPAALTWTTNDNSICSVEDGVLKGLKNGICTVTGQLGDFKDELKVIVEIPESREFIAEKWDKASVSSWEAKATSSKWNPEIISSDAEKCASLNFTYTGGRAPFIQITGEKRLYSLPDKMMVTFNTKDVAVSKILISILPNYYDKAIVLEFEEIKGNEEQTITIDLNEIVENKEDIANYPLILNYIRFNLEGAKLSKNKLYSIELKDIKLVYENITSSIDNVFEEKTIDMYPNPAKDIIHLSEEFMGKEFSVYSVAGQKLMNGKIQSNTINTSALQSGSYILKIDDHATKFIINK